MSQLNGTPINVTYVFTATTNLSLSVQGTIHYRFTNGQQAHPDLQTNQVNYHRVASLDWGHNVVYSQWQKDENTEFIPVNSPIITGYTPDHQQSGFVPATFADPKPQFTVTYQPNVSYANINYIDATNNTKIQTQQLHGSYDQAINYNLQQTITALTKKGYTLVSSDFPTTASPTYNKATNNYTIVFNESTTQTTEHANAIEYIDYAYSNKLAIKNASIIVPVTRIKTVNNVTGKISHSPWISNDGSTKFANVTPHKITGYSPDQKLIEGKTLDPNNTDTLNVTYSPDPETINVKYLDITNGRILKTKVLTGSFGGVTTYNPKVDIANYEAQGYKLIDNEFPVEGSSYDNTNRPNHTFFIKLAKNTPGNGGNTPGNGGNTPGNGGNTPGNGGNTPGNGGNTPGNGGNTPGNGGNTPGNGGNTPGNGGNTPGNGGNTPGNGGNTSQVPSRMTLYHSQKNKTKLLPKTDEQPDDELIFAGLTSLLIAGFGITSLTRKNK
ncbi:mucin-binding protein [Periweissella ghanensis]|uniref:mucin-binding protein n=1 Tax=Periweissella ghanensis TaxID=467997 RepID=UPI0032D58965